MLMHKSCQAFLRSTRGNIVKIVANDVYGNLFISFFNFANVQYAATDAVKLTSHKQSHNVLHFYNVFVRQLSYFYFFHPLLRHSAIVKFPAMTRKHVKIGDGKNLFIVHKINNNNYTLHLCIRPFNPSQCCCWQMMM